MLAQLIGQIRDFRRRKAYQPPAVVRTSTAMVIRAQDVCKHQHYRNGFLVWLLAFGGQSYRRVISIREETDYDPKRRTYRTYYRALVYDRRSRVAEFVDLAPGQLLRVG